MERKELEALLLGVLQSCQGEVMTENLFQEAYFVTLVVDRVAV